MNYEWRLTDQELARLDAVGGDIVEAQKAKKKAWLEANPQRVMNYTKGETAGGWIHVSCGKTPIALVHPKFVDMFIAAPEMYEALKEIIPLLKDMKPFGDEIAQQISANAKFLALEIMEQALAKAGGKR